MMWQTFDLELGNQLVPMMLHSHQIVELELLEFSFMLLDLEMVGRMMMQVVVGRVVVWMMV